MPLRRPVVAIVALYAVLLAPPPLPAQAPATATAAAEPRIEVTGMGESRVAPDRATVMLNVVTKGPSAGQAAAANARVQQQVLDTLRAMGFTGPQVSTFSYNVGPNYEEARGDVRPRQVGYAATNTVRVRLQQLDRVGAVIDAALARGATGIAGVYFEASNTEAAEGAALTQAVQRARANAEVLARALGGRLGALVEVTTAPPQSYPAMRLASVRVMGGGGGYSPETSITPSEIVVPAFVVVRWRFVAGP